MFFTFLVSTALAQDVICSLNPNQNAFIQECVVKCAYLNVNEALCKGMYNAKALENNCDGPWAQSEVCPKEKVRPILKREEPQGEAVSLAPKTNKKDTDNQCDGWVSAGLRFCEPADQTGSSQGRGIKAACETSKKEFEVFAKKNTDKSSLCLSFYEACKDVCGEACEVVKLRSQALAQIGSSSYNDMLSEDCNNESAANGSQFKPSSFGDSNKNINPSLPAGLTYIGSTLSDRRLLPGHESVGRAGFLKQERDHRRHENISEKKAGEPEVAERQDESQPEKVHTVPNGSSGLAGSEQRAHETKPNPLIQAMNSITSIEHGFFSPQAFAQPAPAPREPPSAQRAVLGRSIASSRHVLDLKAYLPGGNGKRQNGINGRHYDIWAAITRQFYSKCADNSLRCK